MKRMLHLALCIIILASLTGCSSNRSVSVKSPVYPESISFDNSNSRIDVREKNKLDESYKSALNSFSYSSASKILSGQAKNINYSPIGLYMALSLAGTGANSNTQGEILSTLGVSGKATDYLSQQNGNLFRLLYSDNEIGKLKIANSLWLQKDIAFKNAFVDNAVQNFYASLYSAGLTKIVQSR